MYRHILIPTDGSRLSESAAGAAIALARALGARVTAVHVTPGEGDAPLESWVHGDRDYPEKLGEALRRRGALYLDEVREAAMRAGVPCECALVQGASPSGRIVSEARERHCDLIVMASHGRHAAGGLAGSETLKVVALGGIPVLAHHPAGAPIETRRTP